jgi:DHA1 family tetracycline resistance protein-like MFS transporter
MSSGIGVLIGALDSVKAGFAVQFCLCLFVLVYVTLILPESLPVGKRSPLNFSAMVPGRSLNILVTNGLFVRLTAILLISTFCNAGLMNVYAAYRTELVGWSRNDTWHATVAGLLATLLWLGGFLRVIMPKLGEPGVLALAQLSTMAYNFVFPVLMHRNQFMVLEFVLRGPISLALPAISSLKSRLVPQSTQGHLQGAITTVQTVCAGLGPVFWCFIYNEWDYHQWEPWAEQIYGHPYFTYYGRAFVFWLACVASLPALWLISKLPKNITHQSLPQHQLCAPLLEA